MECNSSAAVECQTNGKTLLFHHEHSSLGSQDYQQLVIRVKSHSSSFVAEASPAVSHRFIFSIAGLYLNSCAEA